MICALNVYPNLTMLTLSPALPLAFMSVMLLTRS